MYAKNHFFKSTFWGIFSNIILVLSNFLILILLARWLGPTEYGFLPLTLSIVTFVGIFADFGVGQSAARFIVEYTVKDVRYIRSILKDSLFFNLFLGILISSILLIFSQKIALLFGDLKLEPFLKIGAFFLFASNIVIYTDRIFQGFQRIDLNAFRIMVESISKIALAIGLVICGYGAVGAFLGYAISSIIAAFIGIFILYTKFYSVAPNSIRSIREEIFKYSIPLLAINASFLIYTSIDIILLGYFLGTDSVAFYNIPKKIIESLRLPAISLAVAVAPAIAYSKGKNTGTIDGILFYKSIKYLIIFFFPVTVGLAILSTPIINFFVGTEYSSSIGLLRAFSLLLLLYSIAPISSQVLTYIGKAGMRAKLIGFSAILNIILDIVLIPNFGAVGAIYATIITYFPYMFLSLRICINECHLKLSIFKPLIIKVGLSSLFMGLLLLFFLDNIQNVCGLIFVVLMGGSIYGISIFILKLITLNDIKDIINKLINR